MRSEFFNDATGSGNAANVPAFILPSHVGYHQLSIIFNNIPKHFLSSDNDLFESSNKWLYVLGAVGETSSTEIPSDRLSAVIGILIGANQSSLTIVNCYRLLCETDQSIVRLAGTNVNDQWRIESGGTGLIAGSARVSAAIGHTRLIEHQYLCIHVSDMVPIAEPLELHSSRSIDSTQ